MKIRSLYQARDEFPGVVFTDDTSTQQHFADSCDVNKILDKYDATGLLPVNSKTAWYADVSDIPASYQEALEVARYANDHFYALPAKIRDYFGNNVAAYVDFVTEPSEEDIAIGVDLGLFLPPEQLDVSDDKPSASTNTPAENE